MQYTKGFYRLHVIQWFILVSLSLAWGISSPSRRCATSRFGSQRRAHHGAETVELLTAWCWVSGFDQRLLCSLLGGKGLAADYSSASACVITLFSDEFRQWSDDFSQHCLMKAQESAHHKLTKDSNRGGHNWFPTDRAFEGLCLAQFLQACTAHANVAAGESQHGCLSLCADYAAACRLPGFLLEPFIFMKSFLKQPFRSARLSAAFEEHQISDWRDVPVQRENRLRYQTCSIEGRCDTTFNRTRARQGQAFSWVFSKSSMRSFSCCLISFACQRDVSYNKGDGWWRQLCTFCVPCSQRTPLGDPALRHVGAPLPRSSPSGAHRNLFLSSIALPGMRLDNFFCDPKMLWKVSCQKRVGALAFGWLSWLSLLSNSCFPVSPRFLVSIWFPWFNFIYSN